MGGHTSLRAGLVAFIASMGIFWSAGSLAQSDQAPIRLGWSSPSMAKSLQKDVEFHGPFANEDVFVTCDGLGAHDFLEVSFELLLMASWDGSCTTLADGSLDTIGPDYFRFGLAKGPTLVYHTFSNIPLVNPTRGWGFQNEASKTQTYPSPMPGVRLAPHTGAREFNTLGYTYSDPAPVIVPMDATYPVRFIVPHHDASAVVELSGLHLQGMHDENWGIANLKVRALKSEDVPKPTLSAIETAFGDSLGARPDHFIDAYQTLISGLDDTANWIERNVAPVPLDVKAVEAVRQTLLADNSDLRVGAPELLKFGHAIEPYLRDARRTASNRSRDQIDAALQSLGITPIDQENLKRVIVATRVLEAINTPRALSVRKNLTSSAILAGGVPPATRPAEVKAAAPTSRPWDMHFGDAILTLVGVSEFSNEPATVAWWAPDGSPILPPPVVAKIKGPVRRDNSSTRSIAIAFHAAGPSIRNPRILPSPTMPTGGSSIRLNGEEDGWFLFSFLASSVNQTGDVLVRFGNGPSTKTASYSFDPKASQFAPIVQDPEFTLLDVRQINANILGVNFNPPGFTADLDWDVVLMTADGQRIVHESQNGQGQLMGRGMLYHYRTSADQIRQILYDSRQWHAMQLKNFSLYPGQKTQPTVGDVSAERAPQGARNRGRGGLIID